MKKIDDIKNFQLAIDGTLNGLEGKRKQMQQEITKIRYWHGLSFLLASVGVYCFSDNIGILYFAIIILTIIIESFIVESKRKKFRNYYKNNIINLYLKHLYPQSSYLTKDFAFEHHLLGSKLFGDFNFYLAEDGFKGKTNHGYFFHFFEVFPNHIDDGEKSILRDLFWTIQHPNIRHKQIMILPKSSTIVSITKNIVKSFKKSDLQQLDFSKVHSTFAQEFDVYSLDAAEAEHLLTTERCQAFVNLKEQCGVPISMSFVGTQFYLWVSNQNNYFEIKADKPVEATELHKQLIIELTSCFDVLDELSLQLHEQTPHKKSEPGSDNWDDTAYDHLIDNND